MKSNTVLIVDDEKNILSAINRTLMDDDYHIITAMSGKEGLSVLRDNDADLVISDQNMPGMTGLEFLKKVKTEYPHIAGIMLTAYSDIEAATKAVNEAGIYKFILKPWNDADLRITVKRALEAQKLLMERDSLLQSIKTQDILFSDLEKKYPGITQAEKGPKNRHAILIVDDEKSILKSATRILIDDDYLILTALNGEKGLSILESREVDLVVSDQRMPGMSGLEFLKEVRAKYPDILTIMLTAYADADTAITAINEAGVFKFILKPWNDANFRITIARALELRQMVIERNLLAQETDSAAT